MAKGIHHLRAQQVAQPRLGKVGEPQAHEVEHLRGEEGDDSDGRQAHKLAAQPVACDSPSQMAAMLRNAA